MVFADVAQIIIGSRVEASPKDVCEKRDFRGLRLEERSSVKAAFQRAGASSETTWQHMTVHIYYHPSGISAPNAKSNVAGGDVGDGVHGAEGERSESRILIERWHLSLRGKVHVSKIHRTLLYRSLYLHLRLTPLARVKAQTLSPLPVSYTIIKERPLMLLDGPSSSITIYRSVEDGAQLLLETDFLKNLANLDGLDSGARPRSSSYTSGRGATAAAATTTVEDKPRSRTIGAHTRGGINIERFREGLKGAGGEAGSGVSSGGGRGSVSSTSSVTPSVPTLRPSAHAPIPGGDISMQHAHSAPINIPVPSHHNFDISGGSGGGSWGSRVGGQAQSSLSGSNRLPLPPATTHYSSHGDSPPTFAPSPLSSRLGHSGHESGRARAGSYDSVSGRHRAGSLNRAHLRGGSGGGGGGPESPHPGSWGSSTGSGGGLIGVQMSRPSSLPTREGFNMGALRGMGGRASPNAAVQHPDLAFVQAGSLESLPGAVGTSPELSRRAWQLQPAHLNARLGAASPRPFSPQSGGVAFAGAAQMVAPIPFTTSATYARAPQGSTQDTETSTPGDTGAGRQGGGGGRGVEERGVEGGTGVEGRRGGGIENNVGAEPSLGELRAAQNAALIRGSVQSYMGVEEDDLPFAMDVEQPPQASVRTQNVGGVDRGATTVLGEMGSPGLFDDTMTAADFGRPAPALSMFASRALDPAESLALLDQEVNGVVQDFSELTKSLHRLGA